MPASTHISNASAETRTKIVVDFELIVSNLEQMDALIAWKENKITRGESMGELVWNAEGRDDDDDGGHSRAKRP